MYSEKLVASYLGQVPPGFPEARTSCSVVIVCLLVLLPALFWEPHGQPLLIGDLLGSGPQKNGHMVVTAPRPALRLSFEGAAMLISPSGQST